MEDVKGESVGYVKFRGEAVADGTIGANAAGTALLAVDECIRYFNKKQSRGFATLPYEIPVQTTKGSWEVWLIGGLTIYGGAYLKKAAEKMAENDFKDVGLKDVLKKSFGALKTLVELVKHTKGNLDWASTELSWRANNALVGVINADEAILFVPLEYFQWYLDLPPSLLKRLTQPVEPDRTLAIGIRSGDSFEEVEVTALDKEYFGHEVAANEDDFLFPELEHGAFVRLEGRLTRGNENTNSVGLEYQGHILNCIPEVGNIKNYKPALFLRCVVEGTVSRLTRQHTFAERRPTIVFSRIIPLEEDSQHELFGR
jgi:hypothetical protein